MTYIVDLAEPGTTKKTKLTGAFQYKRPSLRSAGRHFRLYPRPQAIRIVLSVTWTAGILYLTVFKVFRLAGLCIIALMLYILIATQRTG